VGLWRPDLPQTATLAEAQTAYRRIAKERHPDQATDPADRINREERMTRLNAAWELIEKHHGRP
jgi:curved DNA-binding protein CbpA